MMEMIVGEFSIRTNDLGYDFDYSLTKIRIGAPRFKSHEDDLEINNGLDLSLCRAKQCIRHTIREKTGL